MAESRGRQRVKPARYQDEDDEKEKEKHSKKEIGSTEKKSAANLSADDNNEGASSSADDKSIISNASSSRRPGISKPKLQKDAVAILETWFNANINNPYPSKEAKLVLMERSGLKQKQVESWMEKQRRKKGVQKQCFYSEEAKSKLEAWFNTHQSNPYPTKEDKEALSAESGLSIAQVSSYMEKRRAKKKGLKRKKRKSTEAAETTEMARVVANNNNNDDIGGLMAPSVLGNDNDELFAAQYQQPPHYQQQQQMSTASLPSGEVKQVLEI